MLVISDPLISTFDLVQYLSSNKIKQELIVRINWTFFAT